MAKLSPAMGEMSGKLDNVIVYQLHGKQYVRRKPSHVGNPRTDNQQRNRSTFGTSVHLASCMVDAVGTNMRSAAAEMGMYAHNLFTKLNRHCFVKTADGVEINWRELQVSAGPLPVVVASSVEMDSERTVTVRFSSPEEGGRFHHVWLYAYAPDTEESIFSKPVHRAEGVVSMQLFESLHQGEVHLYLFVRDDDGLNSPSTYVGCVNNSAC